jgi:hypothetical protein
MTKQPCALTQIIDDQTAFYKDPGIPDIPFAAVAKV